MNTETVFTKKKLTSSTTLFYWIRKKLSLNSEIPFGNSEFSLPNTIQNSATQIQKFYLKSQNKILMNFQL